MASGHTDSEDEFRNSIDFSKSIKMSAAHVAFCAIVHSTNIVVCVYVCVIRCIHIYGETLVKVPRLKTLLGLPASCSDGWNGEREGGWM